ncbi:MAG: adenylate kinase [Planctomycetes bacterium]|nr:adenylate kinase [Planctomycetota bacterium]
MPNTHAPRARRVVVVGTTGSGKSSLARAVAGRLGVPHVELDALHNGPNWSTPPDEVFRERVDLALRGGAWVADGNYSRVRDLVWGRAETIVWLDYPLRLVLARLVARTLRRVVTGERLWNGNRETWGTLFSRESILLWALETHGRNRRAYARLFRSPDHMRLDRVRLRSPAEARRWLATLR